MNVVYIFVLSSPALDTKRLYPGGVRSYYTMYALWVFTVSFIVVMTDAL